MGKANQNSRLAKSNTEDPKSEEYYYWRSFEAQILSDDVCSSIVIGSLADLCRLHTGVKINQAKIV